MTYGIDLLGLALRALVPERPPSRDGFPVPRSILIVKLSSLGDVVHALPVAGALRRSFPGIRLTWAVGERAAALVAGHWAVDRTVVFPSSLSSGASGAMRRALASVRAESYDVSLDLQGLARSAALVALAGAPLRLARAGQREGSHLVSSGVPLPPRLHAVEEYLTVARFLGAQTADVRFDLPVDEQVAATIGARVARLAGGPPARLIVVNPTASRPYKAWPDGRWRAVVRTLADHGTLVLVGSRPNQVDEDGGRWDSRALDLRGATTLDELIGLLSRCDLHVGLDSGSLHIAAALGRPVVGLYGPTPAWRLGPYGQPDGAMEHGALCGRGCPAYCRDGRRCLQAITVAEVIERAVAVLRSAGSPGGPARTPRGARPVGASHG